MAEATITEIPFSEFLKKQKKDREDEAKKKARTDKVQASKDAKRLEKIAKELKNANKTQKEALIAEREQIQADQKYRKETTDIRSQEVKDIADSKAALSKMQEQIEANGGVATANAEFVKESNRIQKEEFNLALKEASPTRRKEILKEQEGKDKKQLSVLQSVELGIYKIGDNFTEALSGAGKGIGAFLKGSGLIALLFLLPTILNSEFVFKTIQFVEDKVIPFFKGIYDFFVDTFGEKGKIFIIFTAIAALLAPKLVLGGLFKILVTAVKFLFSSISRGLMQLGDDTMLDAKGRRRSKGKGFFRGKGFAGKAGQFAKQASGLTRFARGAVRATRFLGPIAAGAMAAFDGINAGMEEAKKEGATTGSIIKMGFSGALSGLTFGLISKEGIAGALDKTGETFKNVGKSFNEEVLGPTVENVKKIGGKSAELAKAGFEKTKEGLKGFFGDGEDSILKGVLRVLFLPVTLIKNLFTKLTGIELPGFDEIFDAISEGVKFLIEKIKSIIPTKRTFSTLLNKLSGGLLGKSEEEFAKEDAEKAAEEDKKAQEKFDKEVLELRKKQAKRFRKTPLGKAMLRLRGLESDREALINDPGGAEAEFATFSTVEETDAAIEAQIKKIEELKKKRAANMIDPMPPPANQPSDTIVNQTDNSVRSSVANTTVTSETITPNDSLLQNATSSF